MITVLFVRANRSDPVGYQTNLMVFSPGRYRFLDVTRYGIGLTLIMTVLVPALILWRYAHPDQHWSFFESSPCPSARQSSAARAGHRRLTVPQFTVVTGLLVILLGTLLLATAVFQQPGGAVKPCSPPRQQSR